MGTKGAWTPERRARQAQIIRQNRPWEKSTGPRTKEGKVISSRNAYAGDALHEAKAKLDSTRAAMLEIFGRKRLPKW